MATTVKCSACGAEGQVSDAAIGRSIRCGNCGTSFVATSAPPGADPGAPLPESGDAGSDRSATTTRKLRRPRPDMAGRSDGDIVPQKVPMALGLDDSRLPAISAAVGIIAGLATSLVLGDLVGKESMIGRIFDMTKIESAIPVSIMCMFLWAVTVCGLRWLRTRGLEKLSHDGVVTQAVTILNQSGIRHLLGQLSQPACAASPAHRRLFAVLRQWTVRPSLQDADVLLQQHVANDEEAVHAGYNLVRTFIWAMPVLGLIGTVLGIALAVSGFATFLGGNVDDVGKIKTSLVGVTSGLSFAFLITLEGLLGALMIMLPSSALQAREARLYAAVQHDIVEEFLPALQKVASEATFLKSLTQSSATKPSTESLSMAAFNQALDGALSRRFPDMETWQQAMQTSALALNCSIVETGDLLRRHIGDLGTKMAENLASAGDRAALDMKQVVVDFGAANKQVNELLLGTYQEILSKEREQAGQISQEMALGAAGYLEALSQIERQLAETLGQHLQQFAAEVKALREQSGRVDGVADLQATVHSAMKSWEQAGELPRSLASLERVIDRLTPALEKLVRPKVFRLVDIEEPMASRNPVN